MLTKKWMASSRRASVLVAVGCLVSLSACSSEAAAPTATPEAGPLSLSSPAFQDQGLIPINYSCAGANISPPLNWHGVAPAGTQSWAIVMQDLDVTPTPWVQWSLTGIAAQTRSVGAGEVPQDSVTNRASNGSVGFVGVCPPQGKAHNYQFTVFAMGNQVAISTAATADQTLTAIQNAAVGSVTLTGRFAR